MAILTVDEGIRILADRMKYASLVIYTFLGVSGGMLLGEILEVSGFVSYGQIEQGPLEMVFGIVGLGYLVIYLTSVVLIAMWIYRAHANLRAAGFDDLEFSPGWAVGWYFVPFMNLFKPFQAMKELWNTSHLEANSFSGEAPSSVGLWWATFIGGNILANVSFRLQNAAGFEGSGYQLAIAIGAVATLLTALCAWKLLSIIRDITAVQQSGLNAAVVFS